MIFWYILRNSEEDDEDPRLDLRVVERMLEELSLDDFRW
jgi:hypothetical protein